MLSTRKWFYGWAVVGGAFVSHFLGYGTLVVAFGIFFPFMAESLSWSRGLLASATILARGAAAVAGPLLGHRVDRHGPRPFIFLGGISMAAGAAILALVHSPWQLFVGYGLFLSVGAVALSDLTADSTVSKWFVRRRGRALAFSTMGMSSAGIALPITLAFLISHMGWRATWGVLAVAILMLAFLVAPVMRRRPEDHGMVPDGEPSQADTAPGDVSPGDAATGEVSLTAKEAIRTPAFWLLAASTNLAAIAIFGINLHMFSYITDQGVSVAVAAGTITYLYFLQTAAKPLWGFIGERLHVRYCLAACYAGGALGIVILMGASTLPGFLAFATVYGLTRGAQSFVSSLAWSDYFGRDAQGAIRGALFPIRFVSGSIGPVMAGLLFDFRGDYTMAFSAFVAVFALGSLTAVMARPPARRTGQPEVIAAGV
ncbi:MAG: hypothetical protein BZY80_06565 [SAR202 cluster bacterium Io17-Chloro-G2]|nr:MAG: hypothetical protein BZY80_06565 [SAR202 cluster bacterium Io17-Chloro-G2]